LARATTRARKGATASKTAGKKLAKKAAAGVARPRKSPTKKPPAKKSVAKRVPAKRVPAKQVPAKQAAKSAAKAGAPASRPRDKSSAKFLEEQKSALVSERESYVNQAETLKAEADQMAQEAEPGDVQFDEESGEGGTMNIDRERDLALSAQARAAVEDIDVALGKIASGTYGTCERCGQPIPKARLKALPQARLCVACKSGGLSRR